MPEANANLLCTYDPSYPVESEVEAEDILALIHAKGEFVGPTVRGVHKLLMHEDPKGVVPRLKYLHDIEPEKFLFTKRWIPVGEWCSSNLADIADAVSRLGDGVGQDESWKIVLNHEGRSSVQLGKLIDTLSHCILRPRSSLDPERIVHVFILGDQTAVSLLRPQDVLEVASKLPLPVDRQPEDSVSVG